MKPGGCDISSAVVVLGGLCAIGSGGLQARKLGKLHSGNLRRPSPGEGLSRAEGSRGGFLEGLSQVLKKSGGTCWKVLEL